MAIEDTETFYKNSLDYLYNSVERKHKEIKLSRLLALGGGMLTGSGLVLAVDGHPFLGAIAAVSGACISWQMSGDALSEQENMLQDLGYIENYEQRLLQIGNENSEC